MPAGRAETLTSDAGARPAEPALETGAADPTQQSLWRPLFRLQQAMDADIARIYAEADINGLKPNFVLELLRLGAQGPMTISELAESVDRTHSALSQKVAAMRAAGLVRTTVGADARTRKVTLTAKARKIVGKLAAEWRATESTLADLEGEIPYPVSRVVTDVEQALGRKSFHDRIAEKLAADPAWAGPAPASSLTGEHGTTRGGTTRGGTTRESRSPRASPASGHPR